MKSSATVVSCTWVESPCKRFMQPNMQQQTYISIQVPIKLWVPSNDSIKKKNWNLSKVRFLWADLKKS
jgi:ribosomal protein L28